MNPETTTVANWVVGLIATGAVAVLGFLIKKAFNDTTNAVTAVSVKLDVITAAQARSDGDVRELKARYDAKFEDLFRRLENVERVQREIVS